MNDYSCPPSRNKSQAAGVKSSVAVPAKGNGPVNGKVASSAPSNGNGPSAGPSIKGHANAAVKGGFIKV